MVDAADMKHWRDAGHVARRTLEAIKDEIKVGARWHDVIESAERYICLLYTSPSPRDRG